MAYLKDQSKRFVPRETVVDEPVEETEVQPEVQPEVEASDEPVEETPNG